MVPVPLPPPSSLITPRAPPPLRHPEHRPPPSGRVAHRYLTLFAVSCASTMVTFSDSIYLPSLTALAADLGTSAAAAALSVALYLIAAGVGALFWGPAADRWGRRPAYWACGALFMAATLVCAFAPNMTVFLIFRTCQGAAVTSFLTTGNAVIADVFAPERRGWAQGIFLLPLLVRERGGPCCGRHPPPLTSPLAVLAGPHPLQAHRHPALTSLLAVLAGPTPCQPTATPEIHD